MRNRNSVLASTARSAISMPASKPPVGARLLVEPQRRFEIGVGDRPRYARRASVETICLAQPSSLAAAARPARQTNDAAAARRVVDGRRLERPGDRHRVERGLHARMPVHVEVREARLALGFLEREGLARERDADVVRTRADT